MTLKRVNTIAPATLVALTMLMAVGSGPQTVLASGSVGDRTQVAQLLAAVKHAAKVLNGKPVSPVAALAPFTHAQSLLPSNACAYCPMDDQARLVLPGPSTPHLIDLPPPALGCI